MVLEPDNAKVSAAAEAPLSVPTAMAVPSSVAKEMIVDKETSSADDAPPAAPDVPSSAQLQCASLIRPTISEGKAADDQVASVEEAPAAVPAAMAVRSSDSKDRVANKETASADEAPLVVPMVIAVPSAGAEDRVADKETSSADEAPPAAPDVTAVPQKSQPTIPEGEVADKQIASVEEAPASVPVAMAGRSSYSKDRVADKVTASADEAPLVVPMVMAVPPSAAEDRVADRTSSADEAPPAAPGVTAVPQKSQPTISEGKVADKQIASVEEAPAAVPVAMAGRSSYSKDRVADKETAIADEAPLVIPMVMAVPPSATEERDADRATAGIDKVSLAAQTPVAAQSHEKSVEAPSIDDANLATIVSPSEDTVHVANQQAMSSDVVGGEKEGGVVAAVGENNDSWKTDATEPDAEESNAMLDTWPVVATKELEQSTGLDWENSEDDHSVSDHERNGHKHSPTKSQYKVGSTYFLLRERDGIEYPVRILSLSKHGTCIVTYEHHRARKKVRTANLLPDTPERRRKFEEHQKKGNADSDLPARISKEVKQREADKQAKKEERHRFGPRISRDHLPRCSTEGALLEYPTRRVYFAVDRETVKEISKKFHVPSERIVYDNKVAYPTLKKTSRLRPLTSIVLPP